MLKLTEKTKYRIDDNGDALIYARLKSSGKFAVYASCHVSCIEHIKKAGSVAAAYKAGIPIRFNEVN